MTKKSPLDTALIRLRDAYAKKLASPIPPNARSRANKLAESAYMRAHGDWLDAAFRVSELLLRSGK